MGDGQASLENVQLDLEEELVAGDLFGQLAWVSRVEFDPQVEGHVVGQVAPNLTAYPLGWVQPVGLVVGVLKHFNN